METNLLIYVASMSTIFAFGLGGVIGWIYRGTVDQNTYKRQLDNLHPEFLDGNGSVSYTHLTLPTKRKV